MSAQAPYVDDEEDQDDDLEEERVVPYVQFPETFYMEEELERVHSGDPANGVPAYHLTTLWFFTLLNLAKSARRNGSLVFAGRPITPEKIGLMVPQVWNRIETAWVHRMIAEGIFTLCPRTGAIVIPGWRRWYQYPSDSPEERRERKRKSRANQKAKKSPESRPAEKVTTGHESHDRSQRSQPVTDVTTSHECHDNTNLTQPTPTQPTQTHSLTPSECRAGAEGVSERASDSPFQKRFDETDPAEWPFWSEVDEAASLAADRLAEAFAGAPQAPRRERLLELSAAFAEKNRNQPAEWVARAIDHGSRATSWSQRDGPGVTSATSHFAKSAKEALWRIADTEHDRKRAIEAGQADPGPAEWIAPDEEAMLK